MAEEFSAALLIKELDEQLKCSEWCVWNSILTLTPKRQ